jgi:hypothetical protein
MVVKLFDGTFFLGSALVIAALIVATAAIVRDDLPIIGVGVGALLAVGVLGMAGCAVAGISQAPALGWTAPAMVLGTALGLLALLILASGVFGWTSVLAPIAQLLPGGATSAAPATSAILGLALLIGVKWLIAIVMAATAH